ncbi:hypothetical protein [Enterococcus sp. ZJ1622]|uniref:hypothetical protein n=1 Tax=Enterococcus sp. ZJ1622 TaxID=2709401 RepID=UPI0013EBF824|nr:hypothetical protein [Enterococcus sp. ZJ1622]
MEISFHTTLTPETVKIELEQSKETLLISHTVPELAENAFYLFYSQRVCTGIGKTVRPKTKDTVIMVQLPWDIEADHLMYLLIEQAEEAAMTIEKDPLPAIPENIRKQLTEESEKLTAVLNAFGYLLTRPELSSTEKSKKKPAKARHRWTKEVSEIPFTVNFRGSQATLYWISRNEMLIKRGAKLLKDAPLNKDGSLGYAAKYGEKLRDDHKGKISGATTTDDIIVKSVNEASLLLYFGGTNSWLELVDERGKSMDEWTKV